MLLYNTVLLTQGNAALFIAFNASSASHFARLCQSEFFQGYIDLRTLLVSIDSNEEREFEWIIIVSHQIEKERFEEYRSVNFQDQCDDPISVAKHEAIIYGSILFEHGTTNQLLAKREGVSCDARGKGGSCWIRVFCGGDHISFVSGRVGSGGQCRVSEKQFDSMPCNFSLTRRQGSTSQSWRGWSGQLELQHR